MTTAPRFLPSGQMSFKQSRLRRFKRLSQQALRSAALIIGNGHTTPAPPGAKWDSARCAALRSTSANRYEQGGSDARPPHEADIEVNCDTMTIPTDQPIASAVASLPPSPYPGQRPRLTRKNDPLRAASARDDD